MNSGVPNLQRLLATLNESSSSSSSSDSHRQPWPTPTPANQPPEPSSSSAYNPWQNYTLPPPSVSSSSEPHQGNNTIPFRKGALPPNNSSNNDQHLQHPRQDTSNNSTSRSTTPSKPETATATAPAPPAIPDASLITTWPAALKHITRHILPHAATTGKIKHLISQQHKHEREWWTQREAIVCRHSGRAGNQDKAAELLRSMGVVSAPPIARVDEAADKRELREFDRKVHRALQDMARDYDAQLRRLGVPGFAIRRDLVLGDNDGEMVAMTDAAGVRRGAAGGGNGNGKLDKGELRDLQRRVVEHLEDLLVD